MRIIRQPLSRCQPKRLAEQDLATCGREILYSPEGGIFRIGLHIRSGDYEYIIRLSDQDILAFENLLAEAKTKSL